MLNFQKHKGLQRLSVLSFFALIAIPLMASAGVSQRNGNFYMNYTDVTSAEPDSVMIERTYNSRAIGQGLFGKGWGSDMETQLQLTGDGILVIYENGTGRREHFKASEVTSESIKAAVDQIIEAADKDDAFVDESQKMGQRDILLGSSDARQSWWKRYADKGLLKSTHAGIGSTYHSIDNKFGVQVITRTSSGYVRNSGGQVDEFDLRGFLIRHEDSRRSKKEIHYYRNAEGQIQRIEDGRHVLKLVYGKDGTITSIMDGDDKVLAQYNYRSGLLIRSVDMEQYVYVYRYDKFYNMTGIGYQDGREMFIAYDDHQMVRYVRSPSGRVRHYDYGYEESSDGAVEYTRESVGSGDSKQVKLHKYIEKKRSDGTSYLSNIGQTFLDLDDGLKSDISLASLIGEEKASVQNFYDDKGRVIRKAIGSCVVSYSYNDAGRPTEISMHKNDDQKSALRIQYEYGNGDLLTHIISSEGSKMDLAYNSKKQMSGIRSKEISIQIEYNSKGKISSLAQRGGDTLIVTYDDNGEVKSSTTKSGNRMNARPIIQTLSELIKLTRLTGVNLGI